MLINEMSNRENTKRGGPSVVARLMGMDTLPPETGPTIHARECSSESSRQHMSRIASCEGTDALPSSLPSTAFKQSDDKLALNWEQQYSRLSIDNRSSEKPFQREHPQEEQLQKFKKEFEAWQESRSWESPSKFDRNRSSRLKNEQLLALKNLKKEKLAGYTSICTSVNKLKLNVDQLHGFQRDNSFGKQLMLQTKDDVSVRRELSCKSIEQTSRAKFHEKSSAPCSPSRIVILKSFSAMNDGREGKKGCLPKVLEKGNSIEDLLEEVKKRLNLELEGKGKNDSIRRFTAAHSSSPIHESLTDSKQLTWEIEHSNENITADLGETLRRSESLISYRNGFHFDGQEFPEFIKGEARIFLSDRLKNVLKNDAELEKPMVDDGRAGELLQTKEKSRSKPITAFRNGASFWDHKEVASESVPKHFRHGQVKREPVDAEARSPPNFVRSFSAPVSHSAFKKALLKDHQATEVQNLQRHEESKNDTAIVNKNKKDGFSIKGKVSNLRRTLGLKGNLFGKKVSSMRESTIDKAHYLNPNQSMSLVVRNFGVVKDNSTEVPPSPVSFPCSPMTEHHSPVSPLEVPFVEDHFSMHVSGELSMTLPESKSQAEVIQSRRHGLETASELHDSNEMTPIEDHGEAYVRDVLLLSGLYKAWPSDQLISRLDGKIKPIPSCVFDDLEDKNYKKLSRTSDDDYPSINLGDIVVDRKLLFDLVNQALPTAIDAPLNWLMSERWGHSLTQLPIGQQFFDNLLHQIQLYANPKIDRSQSIENIVVWDVKLMRLCIASREDIPSLVREVERAIIEDLIGDLLLDLSV